MLLIDPLLPIFEQPEKIKNKKIKQNKTKKELIEKLLDPVTEDKIWKLKGIMMSYYKSKIISIKNCSVE